MSLWNLLFNRKKYQKPATLSLSNIKGFLQGHLRHFLDTVEILQPEEHIKEQAIWRLSQVDKECLGVDGCKVCGCNPVEAVWEDRACKNASPCYPEMMDKLEWHYYKQDCNISINSK